MSGAARRAGAGRRAHEEHGAAALEFGLIAPVLFLVMFAIVQYGYFFWSLTTASATSREAARRMVVGTDWTTCAEKWAVTHARAAAVGDRTVTVTRRYTDPTGAALTRAVRPGDLVEVTVSFQSLDLGIPLLPLPNGGVVTQSSRSEVQSVTPVSCEGPGNP